jgi:hypothetical protein
MALTPKVKLKTLVSFPASVVDGVGVDAVNQNGVYQFNLAYDDFAPPVGAVPDATHQNALLWNSVTGSYVLAPVSLIGGISDAPNDGTLYGRKNLAWSAVPAGGGGVPEAPNDGVQYGRQSLGWTPISAGTGAVRYDTGQALTSAQQLQGRQNIYAAPLDALSFNGLQFNGAMDIDQEHIGAAVTGFSSTAKYVVDGFAVAVTGTMVLSAQQVADAPPGYSNSLKITVTTAEAALAAGDYACIRHAVEGFRLARCGFGAASAQPVTIGFWTKIHRTGTYSGSIQNSAQNRSYPFTFAQSAADTWEYKTVSIPGDVAGTWLTTNGIGLSLFVAMACGTTLAGAANAWAASNYLAATGTTNGVAATTDAFQITGVVILPGLDIPSAARAALIRRPFDQDMILCQRYYEKSYNYSVGLATVGYPGSSFLFCATIPASALIGFTIAFQNRKRVAPTMIWYSPRTGAVGKISDDFNGADLTANTSGANGEHGTAVYATVGSASSQFAAHWTADARF